MSLRSHKHNHSYWCIQIPMFLAVLAGICLGQTEWTPIDNPITTKNLICVTYGNGQYYAVGDSGTIVRSTDGRVWSPCSSGVGEYLRGIEVGPDQIIAVGRYGTILTSDNGETWRSINGITSQDLMCVDYDVDEKLWRIGCVDGGVLESSDGAQWGAIEHHPSGACVSISHGVMVFGIIVVYKDYTWGNQARYSSVAYGNGKYVAVGQAIQCTSPPHLGTSWPFDWDMVDYRNGWNCVIYAGNSFIVVGSNNPTLISKDGRKWEILVDQPNTFLSLTCGPGLLVAVGYDGTIKTLPYDNTQIQTPARTTRGTLTSSSHVPHIRVGTSRIENMTTGSRGVEAFAPNGRRIACPSALRSAQRRAAGYVIITQEQLRPVKY